MLNIEDRVFVSILIDGEEIPYANLETLDITEGNGAYFPALRLVIGDPAGTYITGEKALTDGNKISVIVARSMNDKNVTPRKYRLFGKKQDDRPYNPLLKIVGIVDAPKYSMSSVIEAYEGTSDETLRQLSTASGLTYSGLKEYNGSTANDSQIWRNSGKNRAVFASEIVRKGWIGAKSGMSFVVNGFGEMRYRNLIDLVNTPLEKIEYMFTHNTLPGDEENKRKTYLVKLANDNSSAGVMSSWQNYGVTRTQPGLDGEDKKLEKMDVQIPGAFLAINKEVSDMVGRSRRDVSPVDRGNVHENCESAVYQNIRVLSLFNQKMSLLCEYVTEVRPFDVVVYKQADADPTTPVSSSDVYIVMGKTITVRAGIFYAERIELARLSLNMKGTAELKQCGSTATGTEPSNLPDVKIDKQAGETTRSVVAANIKKLRGPIAQVRSVVNAIKTIRAVIKGDMGPVHKAMGELIRQLQSANPGGTNIAMKGLTDTLTILNSSSNIYKDRAFISQQLTNNLVVALGNQVPLIKTSTVMGAEGTIAGIGGQAGINIPLLRTSQAMQEINRRIPAGLAGTNVGSNLSALIGSFDNTVLSACGSWVKEWNTTVGMVKGEIPEITGASLLPQTLSTALRVPNLTDNQLEKILSDSIARPGAYIDVQNFVAREQASLESSMADLDLYRKRLENVS